VERQFILAYLVGMNLIAFFIYWLDKQKAKYHRYRIPEKALFAVALLGGSMGALLGMHVCRHKTKHWYFVIGIPLILILQIIGGVWIYMSI